MVKLKTAAAAATIPLLLITVHYAKGIVESIIKYKRRKKQKLHLQPE